MVFEDILGEYKRKENDEIDACPRCESKDIGTREVGGTTIGFFCVDCKYEWLVKRVF